MKGFKHLPKERKEEGVVLVMALMILSLILVSALSLAKIISNEVKMSVNTGNSIISYYSADSGMERVLYSIKYSRQQSDYECESGCFLSLAGPEVTIEGTAQSYTVSQAIIDATGYTAYDVSYSSPAFVDIMNPSGSLGDLPWGDELFYNYTVAWVIDGCFPYHSSDKLEISYTSFDNNNFTSDVVKRIVLCNCQYGSDECQLNLSSFPIFGNKYYRFMLRPLDSVAESLDFNVNFNGSPIGIKSQASIIVDGKYHNSTFTIGARLPSLLPVSHAFNYIIFSEEPIIKDL